MKISYIFLFSLISLSLSLMVKIEGSHGRYCFMKKLYSEEQINLNFLVSSEKKEELDVKFKNDDKGNILFQTLNDDQSGWYQSPRPLLLGTTPCASTLRTTTSTSSHLNFMICSMEQKD